MYPAPPGMTGLSYGVTHVPNLGNATAQTTTFYHGDHLGSSRMLSSADGYPTWQGTYYPYGMEYTPPTSTDNTATVNHYKFKGKERDAESGLDYFGARYDSSNISRFMSPDPLGGHQEDPQTLNKYVYARNNPLNLTDPTGLDFNLLCAGEDTATCHGGLQGTTTTSTDANGNQTSTFITTVISNDKNGDLVDQSGNYYHATVSGAGVSFSQDGGNQRGALGVFINGTNPTTVQGTGDLNGFNFTFTYCNSASNVTVGGSFEFSGTAEQAEAALDRAGFNSLISRIGDVFDPFHLSGFNFDAVDFRSPGGKGGANSGHFTVHEPVIQLGRFRIPLRDTVPTYGDVHLGEHNPYTGGLGEHLKEVINK